MEHVPSSAVVTPLASVNIRAAGYVIDVVPAVLMAVAVGWIPIFGAMIAGVLLGTYWLFKDVAGASLGKLILGTRVTRSDGTRAGIARRLARNVPLAFGPSLLLIPFIGYGLGPFASFLLFVTEIFVLAFTGQRIGDRLAGTTVMPMAR